MLTVFSYSRYYVGRTSCLYGDSV